jgi:uracil-DNA glycosylase family 4
VSAHRGPRGEIADIARQARSLLDVVRESRWPGFEPPPVPSAAKPGAAPRLPAPSRPPAPRAAVTAVRQRPPAAASASLAPALSAPPATQLPDEPGPWGSLEQIAEAVGCCTKCPLHATRTHTVPGEGAPKARLMFVGEAPGADEDRLGRPFVGAAGQLLTQMIGAMGLEREEVFIANVLKCRPPGNRDPLEHEVAACLPFLRAQIGLIRPQVICSLGRHATHALLARKDSLGSLRGRFSEYHGTPLLPTFHPSYLLRTPADKALAWKDLQQIMARLDLPLPSRHSKGQGGP